MTTTETTEERLSRISSYLVASQGGMRHRITTGEGIYSLEDGDVEWLLGEVSRLRGVLDTLRTRLEDAAAEENAGNDPRWNNGREWGLTMGLRFLADLYPPAGQEGSQS